MTDKTKPIQKHYFDVKVECLTPTQYIYRVYADDEESALAAIKNRAPTSIKPNHAAKRTLNAKVYGAGSSLIKLVKKYI
jgi:hypothetical protein